MAECWTEDRHENGGNSVKERGKRVAARETGEHAPVQRHKKRESEMRLSRKVWGCFVFGLGCLWLLGGIAGYLQGHLRPALLLAFCGMVLARLGRNMFKG
jgi:hypothetical protein